MTPYTIYFFFAAFAFYACAFATNFFPSRNDASRGTLTVAGFILHTCALAALLLNAKSMPLGFPQGLAECVAWLCAATAVAGLALKIDAFKKLTVCAAAVLTVLPAFCPAFADSAAKQTAAATTVQIHAFFAALSYALMVSAAACAAAGMFKRAALKRRIDAANSMFAMPLERLDKTLKIALVGAAAAMAVSIAFGAEALCRADCDIRMGAKIAAGLCVFAVQIFTVVNILRQNIKDAPLEKLALALAAMSLAALIPIEARNIL